MYGKMKSQKGPLKGKEDPMPKMGKKKMANGGMAKHKMPDGKMMPGKKHKGK